MEKIEEIKEDIEKYDKKITSLDDEFEKERVARNMFQMVKENEVIYKYVEKKNKKIEKFSVSMDVAKNNLEEEDYKCSVSSQGEFEIKREEYNVLG